MDKSKLTAQEAFRLTKKNQDFSANSNRVNYPALKYRACSS